MRCLIEEPFCDTQSLISQHAGRLIIPIQRVTFWIKIHRKTSLLLEHVCDIASFALGADNASSTLCADIAFLLLGAPSLIDGASEESAVAPHHSQSLKMANAKTPQASILLDFRYPAAILSNVIKTSK